MKKQTPKGTGARRKSQRKLVPHPELRLGSPWPCPEKVLHLPRRARVCLGLPGFRENCRREELGGDKSNWRVRRPRIKSLVGLSGKVQPLYGPQFSATKWAHITQFLPPPRNFHQAHLPSSHSCNIKAQHLRPEPKYFSPP